MTRKQKDGFRFTLGVITCCLLLVGLTGCPGSGDSDPVDGGMPVVDGTDTPVGHPTEVAPAPKDPSPIPPKPDLPPRLIDPVKMTQTELDTCLLTAGQTIPDAQLQDLAGQSVDLRSVYGQKATVLFFWSSGSTRFSQFAAVGTLKDLDRDVWQPLREQGIGVVAINEGDAPQAIQSAAQSAELQNMPMLIDPQGQLLKQIANAYLPRIYVVDAEGKILWFDIEYSETTREELINAVRYIAAKG